MCNQKTNPMLQQKFVIAIYCIIDDLLKSNGHNFDKRSVLSDSEVLTIGVVSALFFGGVWINALNFLSSFNVFSKTISKSRLCRRLHNLEPVLDEIIFGIGECFIQYLGEKTFILDSTPLEVCDNIRISRCRLIEGEDFRGYQASFRRYFYGLKLQLLINNDGIPVNYAITEGSLHDALGMHEIEYNLSPEAEVLSDAAYNDSEFERLMEDADIKWLTDRKSNSKKPHDKHTAQRIKKMRKKIETTLSEFKSMFKRHIHAVTIEGFMLKIKYFIFALQLKKVMI